MVEDVVKVEVRQEHIDKAITEMSGLCAYYSRCCIIVQACKDIFKGLPIIVGSSTVGVGADGYRLPAEAVKLTGLNIDQFHLVKPFTFEMRKEPVLGSKYGTNRIVE